MAYAFENDELRQEIRLDQSGTVYFWPKIPGVGNVAVVSATYTVHKPDGTEIESGTAVQTAVGSVERLDCSVAAISTLDEDYQVRIDWRYGTDFYFDVVSFDVVKWPYSARTLSLNDLQEERSDIADVLDRLGDYTGKTAEEMASIFGARARVELDAMIRDQVEQDRRDHERDYESAARVVELYSRPNLILNRERLNRVERKIALKLVYAADATDPQEGDDASSALYRYYAQEANTSWRGVGPLKYDIGGDLTIDQTIRQPGRSVRLRRSQG